MGLWAVKQMRAALECHRLRFRRKLTPIPARKAALPLSLVSVYYGLSPCAGQKCRRHLTSVVGAVRCKLACIRSAQTDGIGTRSMRVCPTKGVFLVFVYLSHAAWQHKTQNISVAISFCITIQFCPTICRFFILQHQISVNS